MAILDTDVAAMIASIVIPGVAIAAATGVIASRMVLAVAFAPPSFMAAARMILTVQAAIVEPVVAGGVIPPVGVAEITQVITPEMAAPVMHTDVGIMEARRMIPHVAIAPATGVIAGGVVQAVRSAPAAIVAAG